MVASDGVLDLINWLLRGRAIAEGVAVTRMHTPCRPCENSPGLMDATTESAGWRFLAFRAEIAPRASWKAWEDRDGGFEFKGAFLSDSSC